MNKPFTRLRVSSMILIALWLGAEILVLPDRLPVHVAMLASLLVLFWLNIRYWATRMQLAGENPERPTGLRGMGVWEWGIVSTLAITFLSVGHVFRAQTLAEDLMRLALLIALMLANRMYWKTRRK